MYNYLDHATCMHCNTSKSGLFKHIGKKLICKVCLVFDAISRGSRPESISMEIKDGVEELPWKTELVYHKVARRGKGRDIVTPVSEKEYSD